MCTDIGNYDAPGGSARATISPKAFIKWMSECGYGEIDSNNPGQVVCMLHTGAQVVQGNLTFRPNWHLTAMCDRMKTKVENFHFKIEATKAAAHYWHYVLHYHDTNRTWHWVGAPNPKIPTTNEGGGGAADNLRILQGNRRAVDTEAVRYGLDNKVDQTLQRRLLATLNDLTGKYWIKLKGEVWTN